MTVSDREGVRSVRLRLSNRRCRGVGNSGRGYVFAHQHSNRNRHRSAAFYTRFARTSWGISTRGRNRVFVWQSFWMRSRICAASVFKRSVSDGCCVDLTRRKRRRNCDRSSIVISDRFRNRYLAGNIRNRRPDHVFLYRHVVLLQGCVDLRPLPAGVEVDRHQYQSILELRNFADLQNLIEGRSLIANAHYLEQIQMVFGELDVSDVCLVPRLDEWTLPFQLTELLEILDVHLSDAAEAIRCDWVYKVSYPKAIALSKISVECTDTRSDGDDQIRSTEKEPSQTENALAGSTTRDRYRRPCREASGALGQDGLTGDEGSASRCRGQHTWSLRRHPDVVSRGREYHHILLLLKRICVLCWCLLRCSRSDHKSSFVSNRCRLERRRVFLQSDERRSAKCVAVSVKQHCPFVVRNHGCLRESRSTDCDLSRLCISFLDARRGVECRARLDRQSSPIDRQSARNH